MISTIDIKQQLKMKYDAGFRVGNTVELTGVSFTADSPWILQPPNQEYIDAEIKWYETETRNVNELADIYGQRVKIWDSVADEDGYVNSNYGWCIFSAHNDFQFANVRKTLREDPNSRRAVIIYTRPQMQYDYCAGGMNDFMCTNTVQYLIRGGCLDVIVQMRSNDAVFGYNNDRAWQVYVQDLLCHDLGVEPGFITWQCGSFHVYDRHFHLLED